MLVMLGDEWGDAFKPGAPVLVFERWVVIEDFVEGKDGGVIESVANEPTIAERTPNSFI